MTSRRYIQDTMWHVISNLVLCFLRVREYVLNLKNLDVRIKDRCQILYYSKESHVFNTLDTLKIT